ncbi:MAG: MFS transporter [Pseudomonadota bacterium]
MLTVIRAAWPLLFGVLLLQLSHGLMGTLLGVRANIENFSTTTTGIVMSGFYLGILAGSMLTRHLAVRVGHVRVFAGLVSLASSSVLIFAILVDPFSWFAMRFLTGFCIAGATIVAESWLNSSASNEHRGELLSVYMLVVTGGMALGQFLINIGDPSGFQIFVLASILVSIAIVPMLLTASPVPMVTTSGKLGLKGLFRFSPLATVGIIGCGLSQGPLFAIGPVYAGLVGFSVGQISVFMALLIAGGMLFQWPIGRISDRLDRRQVLTVLSLLAAGTAAFVGFYGDAPTLTLQLLFFLLGGLCIPLYSLCISYVNDYLNADEIVAASGALVMGYGVGAIAGPSIAAALMQWMGPAGLPFWLVAVNGSVGAFAIYRMTQRDSVPLDEQGSYVPIPATSAIAANMAQETASEPAIDNNISTAPPEPVTSPQGST